MTKGRRAGPKASPDNQKKRTGVVYTPPHLVRLILDTAGYSSNILGRHIIDHSCGAGAFLAEIVRRYCHAYVSAHPGSTRGLHAALGEFIHGLDVDADALQACAATLDTVAASFGVADVRWDLRLANTLTNRDFHSSMDFVVGNPPYVRVHNLGKTAVDVRALTFAADGMTDLYLAFFDIGLQLLQPHGHLCLITPSSWLTSKAGRAFREHLRAEASLTSVIDLGHHQAFDATTYTMITFIQKGAPKPTIDFRTFDPDTGRADTRQTLPYDQCFQDAGLFFAAPDQLELLRTIRTRAPAADDPVTVRNGFATLADAVFVGEHAFTHGTIPVVKATTGSWTRCVFPYAPDGEPYSEVDFEAVAPDAMRHLRERRDVLSRRALAERAPWYAFGRNQALRDVQRSKIAVNSIVRNADQLRLVAAGPGHGVYGGLYLRTDVPSGEIARCLRDPTFMRYVRTLRRYKSGGYYTFSAQELEGYLNWRLTSLPRAPRPRTSDAPKRTFSQGER